MNHFLGGHVIRVNLISGQSLGAVKLGVQDIIRIPLVGGADLQPLEARNDANQGLQRLRDFLYGSLLITVFPCLLYTSDAADE